VAVRRGASAEETAALHAAFADDGMRGFWRRWLVYEERTSSGPPRALLMGAIFARIGDADRAIEWLERAYDDRDPGMVYLGTNPDWETLRDDPRFIALMQRMRLPR
jgi:hypothetical protein